jgi:hypothetical protein
MGRGCCFALIGQEKSAKTGGKAGEKVKTSVLEQAPVGLGTVQE